MPPLTLAFIVDGINFSSKEEAQNYIRNNIEDAFVLDGIQRLNTLYRTQKNNSELNLNQPMFLNIIFCESMDNLLYRMITLNNGQKPMTARHQIEILASNIYNFEELPVEIQTEKERKKRIIKGSFNKSDIIKAYIAFLSDSINIDNQRIIEEKLDELIAEKILNSNITEDNLEFSEIISLISNLSIQPEILEWFKVNNNFIGFSVGIRHSYEELKEVNSEVFSNSIQKFEKAFSAFNVSKVRVGFQRRKYVAYFIENFMMFSEMDENDMVDILSTID